jgi:DNA polymerase-3 subunit epsilon
MSNFNENSVDKNQLFLYLDVETTGLDHKKAALIEVSGIFELNGQVVQEFELLINPYSYPREIEVQEKALAVNNRTTSEIQTFIDQKTCFDWLCTATKQYTDYYKCNRPFIIGYNTNFDIQFIQSWFEVNNAKFVEYFQYKYIDVLQFVMALGYIGLIDMFNNNLKDMCLKLDIELNNAHTALADIKATRELFKKLISLSAINNFINPSTDIFNNFNNISNWGSKQLVSKFGIEKNDIVKQYGG